MTAQIAYGDGATKRTIAAVAYGDGATKRVLKAIFYGDGATVRQVFNAYTPITLSGPTTADGSYNCIGPKPATCPMSPTITATMASPIVVSGGNPSPSVSWARVSGSTFAVNNGTTLQPSFTATGVTSAAPVTAVYRCTVSDGTSSATRDVTVTATYNWDSGL